MRGLRIITHVKWQERKSNTEVLKLCNMSGIEAFLMTLQPSLSKDAIFYSELVQGVRSHGGLMNRYKDTLKVNVKRCDIAGDDTVANTFQNGILSLTVSHRLKQNEQSERPEAARRLPAFHVTHADVSVCLSMINDRPPLTPAHSSTTLVT